MKKIIFLFTFILAAAIIYGYSQSGQNKLAENHVNLAGQDALKGINNQEAGESAVKTESFNKANARDGRPDILLILTNYNSKTGKPASFLRSYIYGNQRQEGC